MYAVLRFIRVIIYQNICNSISTIIIENYGNIEMKFENIC